MLFFIVYTKPFAEKALYYANCFSELGLSVIIPLITLFLFDISAISKNQLDVLLLIIINMVLGVHMSSSIVIAGKNVYLRIKNRKKRVSPENEEMKKDFNIMIHELQEEEGKINDLSSAYGDMKLNLSPASSMCQEICIDIGNEPNLSSYDNSEKEEGKIFRKNTN